MLLKSIMATQVPENFVIMIPVYHDWSALILLLQALDRALMNCESLVSVLVIDDGSTIPIPSTLRGMIFERIQTLDVLILKRNLGHQRALATGLSYISAEQPCRAVVLMDGDGEDSPADVPRLLEEFEKRGGDTIVFAERLKRSESALFRLFYFLYRIVHYLLTGIAVRVGNFSVVPRGHLRRLTVTSDLWNHYAAAIFQSRLPYFTLPTRRAPRLEGRSRMNFTALVTHGLSAISVFRDRVGIRLLLVLILLMGMTTLVLAFTILIRLTTEWAIPGWATSSATSLILILLQMCLLVSCFVFLALGGRDNASFLPVRDCPFFIDKKERLFPHGG
jgi:polyisoprenyl-phosphate glycosyltransferase